MPFGKGKSKGNSCRKFSRTCDWYSKERSRPSPRERDMAFGVDQEEAADVVENEKPQVPKTELEKKLHVKSVDLHIEENAKKHNTDKYECTAESDDKSQKAELVCRRGQEFTMSIEFNKPYNIKQHDITLTFYMGDDCKPKKGLDAEFKVDETGDLSKCKRDQKWGAALASKKGNFLTVMVFIPPNCPVGEWNFSIKTVVETDGNKPKIWQYNHNEEINILFNPWCKEDDVYMEDEIWRNETVLNDTGCQFFGTSTRIGHKSWNYGQFKRGILDACYHLTRKSFPTTTHPGMASPVQVSRMISGIINCQDDGGVLEGNWSGDYSGGTSPTKWVGSYKILQKYMDTKKPVKYGQCWVFSAVTTAVCRCLGIPCRSVTNFDSAHNTDQDSLAIDKFTVMGEDGEWTTISNDSVWNFHVWNEVWMARPDLFCAKEMDGWQVIDATPQETSGGVYCCGPAPVKAIKEGQIQLRHDSPFIFAEVNADRVSWKSDPKTGRLFVTKRLKNEIGHCISTCLPEGLPPCSNRYQDRRRFDLTENYKYKHDSEKGRQILKEAECKFKMMNSGSTGSDDSEEDGEPEPLEITIEDPGELMVGCEFDFVVRVKNVTKCAVDVKNMLLRAYYFTYYDNSAGEAKTAKQEVGKIESGKEKIFKLRMDEKTTIAKPQHCYNFKMYAAATLQDKTCVSEEIKYRLLRPDLVIKAPKTCGLFDRIKVVICLKNPLSVNLTNCTIDLNGNVKLEDDKDEFPVSDIPPGGTMEQTVMMSVKLNPKPKSLKASVGFESTQLCEINGDINVLIQ